MTGLTAGLSDGEPSTSMPSTEKCI